MSQPQPSRENLMFSTEPEAHNILHSHQKRTKPWPQVAGTEKFREVLTHGFCDMQADRSHTDTMIAILRITLVGQSND